MSKRSNGMSAFRAGVLALVVVGLCTYFGFSKANPFANPYEFKAVFHDVNNLKPKSPVRIAGVDVGKVVKVEAVEDGKGAAQVTMEVEEKGLPIKEDAELKIRPRIFLEGNFFVDVEPGSPSAGDLERDEVIPVTQTAAPVQWGDLLTALQSDTREDLKTFLREYSKGLDKGGADGLQPGDRVLGAGLPQLVAGERRDARPGPEPRRPAPAGGPAEDVRRDRPRRARPEGPRHQLQRHRRARSRARTRRWPPRSRRCATRCAPASPRSAR